ncbi:MAG TPA: DnaJ domain-containing protein [Myxococcales bacterium]|nr:DnaJ domain-containing protein [Myxococcales bacterium]
MGAAQDRGGHLDLPEDIQRELQDLEARGERLTHYQLLGVAADADGGAIRRAYLEKSKRFHPDAWYRKQTGPFAPLLSKWFQKLSAACQVLSDEELRSAYDREHRAELSQEDRAAVQRRELSRAEQERRERERRERLLRTKGFARIGAARKLYEEALEHAGNGDRANAISALKSARELDPNRREIAAKLMELEREQARARASSALASGKEREEGRRPAEALAAYSAAFQYDPASFSAAAGAARSAFAVEDLRAAFTWASRAVEMQPGDSASRLILARVLVATGQKARARSELQELLTRTPDCKEARALLRAL